MSNKEIINEIRAIIGEGDMKEAFFSLEKYGEISINQDTRDNVIQLKSRYNVLKTKQIKGIISTQDFSVELNNITNDTLSLLLNIEEVIDYHEENIKEKSKNSTNFKTIHISKYVGQKGIFNILKTFFTRPSRVLLSLYIVKTKQYYLISCSNNICIESLSNHLGTKIFPNLIGQHFIWKLEQDNRSISRLTTVGNSELNSNKTIHLTAEYKYHDELWNDSDNKKIIMKDFTPIHF